MIWRKLQSLLVISLLVLPLTSGAGCADESAPAEGEGEGAEGEGEGGMPTCDVAAGEICASIDLVEPVSANISIFLNGQQTVKVRYTRPDPSGQKIPVPGAPVSWTAKDLPNAFPQLVTPANGAGPQESSTVTDAQGYATNTIKSGKTRGSYKLVISAYGAADLELTIDAMSKEEGSMLVKVAYPAGAFKNSGFGEVKVYGWKHTDAANPNWPTCADINPSVIDTDIDDNPTPRQVNVNIPLPLPNQGKASFLKNGEKYTVVAVARKAMNVGDPLAAVASACDEGSAVITGGEEVTVNLTLTDLVFNYTGRYRFHMFLNFLAMIPGDASEQGSIEFYVQKVADFFTNPGDFVITTLSELIASQFAGFPSGTVDTFKPTLARIINAILEGLLPPWAQNIFTVGGDIFTILQDLEVVGTYDLKQNPVASDSDAGLLLFPACTEGQPCAQVEKWDTLYFNWRLGRCQGLTPDPTNMCGRTPFSLSSFVAPGTNGQPMAAVEGGFDASVRNIYDLTIKQHSLALNYGAIILGVVEKLVIPAVTDGKATNLKDLVFWMLGGKYPEEHPQYPGQECVDAGTGTVMQNCCEALSWKVSQDNATWRDVTKSICEAGVPVLVDTLTSYLVGLQVDSGSTLVVGTSDAFEELPAADRKACKMAFKIYNGRMTLWTMGAEAQDKRCNLRAGLKIADWPIDFAEATFYTEERLGDAE